MQPLINAMAVAGFVLSSSMTAALVISYMQFDKFMDDSIEQIGGKVTEKIEEQLDGKIKGVMPKMPDTTGPALPF